MNAARFSTRALLAGLALALVAVPFGLLVLLVKGNWDPLLDVDERARDSLHAFAVQHDWFVSAMKTLGFLGSGLVYWIVFGGIVVWLLARRLPRLAAFVAVTIIGGGLLNAAVKALVDRARPVLHDPVATAPGLSFPSGHAQGATVAAGVLLLVFLPALHGGARQLAIAAAVAWIALIAFSRVALGVHFVTDVLGGIVLGAAWLATMTALFSAWRRERGDPPVRPERGLEPEHANRLGPAAGRG